MHLPSPAQSVLVQGLHVPVSDEKVLPWHTSHLTPSRESFLPASQNVQVVRVGENILVPPTTRGAAHSVQSSAQAS